MKNSINLKLALAAAVTAVVGVSSASAAGTITFDLRAASVSGVGSVGGAKSVTGDVGSIVTLDLWVRVTGTDNILNETLRSGYGILLANSGSNLPQAGSNVAIDAAINGNTAIYGTPTTLKGDFQISGTAKANLVTPYNAGAVAANGVLRDLNNDTTLDIGGTSSTGTAGFLLFDAAVANGESGTFVNLGTSGREWKVGTWTFAITSAGVGSSTGVNYAVPVMNLLSTAARWSFGSDGATVTGGAVAQAAVSAPVMITAVPEPSAFGMVLVGALGLVGFRRLGFRRSA